MCVYVCVCVVVQEERQRAMQEAFAKGLLDRLGSVFDMLDASFLLRHNHAINPFYGRNFQAHPVLNRLHLNSQAARGGAYL